MAPSKFIVDWWLPFSFFTLRLFALYIGFAYYTNLPKGLPL
jgi:hypothetical protein